MNLISLLASAQSQTASNAAVPAEGSGEDILLAFADLLAQLAPQAAPATPGPLSSSAPAGLEVAATNQTDNAPVFAQQTVGAVYDRALFPTKGNSSSSEEK